MTAPANPFASPVTPEIWATHHDFCGMTLRDWFAGQALPAALDHARENIGVCSAMVLLPEEWAARMAYGLADAMLAERAK